MAAATREQETIRGVLGTIVWRDQRGEFTIAKLQTFEGPIWVIKGALGGLVEGDSIAVSGEFVQDPRWGRQFKVSSAKPELPRSGAAIETYLSRAKIPGVGPKLAGKIVAQFGDATLDVITEAPEKLKSVSGLGARKLNALLEHLRPRLEEDKKWMALYGLPLSPAVIQAALKRWEGDAVRVLHRQPYRTMALRGVGFVTADRLARHLGLARDAPERVDAGLDHVLVTAASQGHTAPHASAVTHKAAALLELPEEQVIARVAHQLNAGELIRVEVDGEPHLAGRALHEHERRLASCMRGLLADADQTLSDEERQARVGRANRALGFELVGAQRRAVELGLTASVMVVTGGPGTGKTTLIQGLLAALAPDDPQVVLAAPTGRAARRLSESTGHDASTLHRLLEVDPVTGGFQRGATEPIAADLVIVDECSMLDVPLARALCEALPSACRLILVGDVDQLPSVGPGAVLQDLIACEAMPVCELTEVHRQAQQSSIIRSAHAVRRGAMPRSDAKDSSGDFFIVPRKDPQETLKTVVQIVRERLPARYGYDPLRDVQVLVPTHRGTLGTETLNEALMTALVDDRGAQRFGFREGEKVIQLRNNYELDIFNGDVGHVSALAEEAITVQFGERSVQLNAEAAAELRRAYAITVHKSQGSEYPAVVLVLHGQHHVMLQRNLLYTALTRARRFCVIVGTPSAIERAIQQTHAMRRHTLLRTFMREHRYL